MALLPSLSQQESVGKIIYPFHRRREHWCDFISVVLHLPMLLWFLFFFLALFRCRQEMQGHAANLGRTTYTMSFFSFLTRDLFFAFCFYLAVSAVVLSHMYELVKCNIISEKTKIKWRQNNPHKIWISILQMLSIKHKLCALCVSPSVFHWISKG